MALLPIDRIVQEVTEKIYENEPSLLERFGEKGKLKCTEDNHHHFNHLKTAFELNDIQVFADYAAWLNGILRKHGMKTAHLLDNFSYIEEVLQNYENEVPDIIRFYRRALEAGKDGLLTMQNGGDGIE